MSLLGDSSTIVDSVGNDPEGTGLVAQDGDLVAMRERDLLVSEEIGEGFRPGRTQRPKAIAGHPGTDQQGQADSVEVEAFLPF